MSQITSPSITTGTTIGLALSAILHLLPEIAAGMAILVYVAQLYFMFKNKGQK